MKLAVESGYWTLYRYDPRLIEKGKKPLQLDSKPQSIPLVDYFHNENRFTKLERSDAEHFEELVAAAEIEVKRKRTLLEALAALDLPAKEAVKTIAAETAVVK